MIKKIFKVADDAISACFRRTIFISTCLLLQANAYAAPAIPLEDFLKDEKYNYGELSPDGKYMAIATIVQGERYLSIMDLENREITVSAKFEKYFSSFDWISNNRVLICCDYVTVSRGKAGREQRALDADGKNIFDFRDWYYKSMSAYPDEPGYVMLAAVDSMHNRRAFKVNTFNGERSEIPLNFSGSFTGFWVDGDHVPRLITARKDADGEWLWYRESASAEWRKIAELTNIDPIFRIAGFDSDNKTLYVASRAGGDKYSIYKYDFSANKIGDLVISDPNVDIMDQPVRDSHHKVIGFRIKSDPPRTYWLDEAYRKAQENIDATFPDTVNEVSGDIHTKLLVHSYSATNRGRYAVYDPAKDKILTVFQLDSFIKPEQLADQLLFNYSAKDGLDIPAYLTFPKNRPQKALPLVVLAHNGPWSRTLWGYDRGVQLLASMGYAVLQPQYRGSFGFGWNHFKKGWGEFGLSMQDDLTDGVNNLVKQGLVDPKRVCIMGYGYGGYAALMGVVKDPDFYRCAIDVRGFANVDALLAAHLTPSDDERVETVLIGKTGIFTNNFVEVSPLKQADKIKSPVLIAALATDDPSNAMYRKLKWGGKIVVRHTIKEIDTSNEIKETKEQEYDLFHAIQNFLETYNPAD